MTNFQYDVFISYSRDDIDEVRKICAQLDANGISYWIDHNIKGSANFLHEITKYIAQCKVVLFVASRSSANSQWTQKEVLFAINHNKKILPYRVGEFTFESNMELEFVFSNVQWIESHKALISDILALCRDTHVADPIKLQPQPKSKRRSYKGLLFTSLAIAIIAIIFGVYYIYGSHSAESEASRLYDPVTEQWFECSADDGLYPLTRLRLLQPVDIEGMTRDELRLMRNEIYARHGYIFSSRDLQEHFLAQPWYSPRSRDVEAELSEIERRNVLFIKKYE